MAFQVMIETPKIGKRWGGLCGNIKRFSKIDKPNFSYYPKRRNFIDTLKGNSVEGTTTVCTGGECINYIRIGCVKYQQKCTHTRTVCEKKLPVCVEFHQPKCVQKVVRCKKYDQCNCIEKESICLKYEKNPKSCKRYQHLCIKYKVECSNKQKVCQTRGKCQCLKYEPKKCVERCPSTLLRERKVYCSIHQRCRNRHFNRFHRRKCAPYWQRCGPRSYYCTERLKRCEGRNSRYCSSVVRECSSRRS
jgi:hypothetical protein